MGSCSWDRTASITETSVSLAEATRLFYGTVRFGTNPRGHGRSACVDSGLGEEDVVVVRPLHIDDAHLRPLTSEVGGQFGRVQARFGGDEVAFREEEDHLSP